MSRVHLVVAVTAIACVLGRASTGYADRVPSNTPPPPAIRWSAPAGCPDQQTIVRSIETQLGGPLDVAGQSFRAEIEVEHDPDGTWRLHLATRTKDATGGRVIEGSSCQEVAEAVVVIIALAVQAEAEAAPSHPAPVASLSAPATPGGAIATQWLARAELGGDAGGIPSGPGLGIAIGFVRGHVRIEAAGDYWVRRRATSASNPAMGGDLDLLAGTLRLCYALSRFEISPCLGLELGSLHASGVGVTSPVSSRAAWVAPVVGFAVPWQIVAHLYVLARIEVGVPMRRPHFVLDGVPGDVYQPSAVVGHASLGIEVRFP